MILGRRRFALSVAALISFGMLSGLAIPFAAATTCAPGHFCGTLYYTQIGAGVNTLSFDYNSISPSVAWGTPTVVIGSLPGGADGLAFDSHLGTPVPDLLVGLNGGGGTSINVVDPNSATLVTSETTDGQVPSHVMVDPSGNTGYTTADPGTVVSIPLNPLGPGTSHALTGDDGTTTGSGFGVDTIVWSDATHAFYTSDHSGDFGGGGDVGTINLSTFVTTCFKAPSGACMYYPGAHGMAYDPFTGDLFIFGATHITQLDTSGNVISDLTVPGAQFDQGTVDGNGHLLVADNNGHILFDDYSVTKSLTGSFHTELAVSSPDDVAPLIGPGSPVTSAPEFPIGILALFVVAVPAMLLLRARLSTKP